MDHIQSDVHQVRKAEHLSICLQRKVESDSVRTGFDGFQFVHEALPEVNLEDVDTNSQLLAKELSAPFMISSMTGGLSEGGRINRVLAEAAQIMGVAIGVGSQRVGLLNPSLADTFKVRQIAPDVFLCANLGGVQLNNGFSLDECRAAVDMIDADALVLHLNPLQESVQSGGNTNFEGLVRRIESICASLEVPVIVKEVGQGISERSARVLMDAGVAAIDIAGAGGTSWSLVESIRERNGKSEVGATFSDWGIPTAESIIMARRGAPDIALIASGGVRSGLDAAKSIALGANLVAFGLPVLKEAVRGVDAVLHLLRRYRDELRTAMFCIGAHNLDELYRTSSLMRRCPMCGGLSSVSSSR